jgi:tetratricopeptide (TPR) repeat protein
MANSRTILIISILAMIVSLLGGIATNVASSALPESWTPYLWLAWPIFIVFLVISIAVLIWQVRESQPPPTLPSRPAYVHEGWFLKHYYVAYDDFTGRKSELNFLTNWLQNDDNKPLLVLLALGGFGKSALVWHWLNNETAPKTLPKVVWWGYYDDNSFDTFLRETLEYLDIEPRALSISEQVEMLARYVHQNRILIVMDGFERALRAYNSMNAAYQGDEENKSEITNNQCVSIHAGRFLQRVASLNAQGRVLLTSRLLPDDLKIRGSEHLIVGCLPHDLDKLSKEDAVEFFKKQKIKGTRAEIESACEVYGYHPLSLRLLAGRIVKDRSRDIKLAEKFKIDADLKGRQNHILKVAYDSLPRNRRLLLSKIAAFRSPMDFNAIKIFEEKQNWFTHLLFDPQDLQTILNDFVIRGLSHHDPNKDQYDLHPIVRRFAYDRLTASDRTAAHARLADYFEAVPKPQTVTTLEDLAPVIELYHHIVRAGNLDEAMDLLYERFANALLYKFGAYQLYAELLRTLFLDGEDKPPRLKREGAQAWTLNALANAYSLSGQPRRAVQAFEMIIAIDEKNNDKSANAAITLGNVATQQLVIGALGAAERNLRRCMDLCREIADEHHEAIGHRELGRVLFSYCEWNDSEQAIKTAEKLFGKEKNVQSLGITWSYRALRLLLLAREEAIFDTWKSNNECRISSIQCAQRALELADEDARTDSPVPRDYVRAYWLLGAAYCANNELTLAEENLSKALNLCRQINSVDTEADILLDLARLRYAQGDFKDAQEKASEALMITERSGYVLQGADANLFLAQYALEQEQDKVKAKEYAESALKLATCDGPPYYYKVAYEEAERMLEGLKK